MRNALITAAAGSALAVLAAEKGAAAAAPKADAAKTAEAKPAPVLTAISVVTSLPQGASRGGGKASIYPFAELAAPTRDEAGNITGYASFGVKNKTAREMSSIVSNANKKYRVKKTDANGAVVFKTKEIDVGGGQMQTVPTSEPEMVAGRKFSVYAVDPKTDADGATARVYREL